MDEAYCFKCKLKTKSINTAHIYNRNMLESYCGICDTKRTRFVKNNINTDDNPNCTNNERVIQYSIVGIKDYINPTEGIIPFIY